MVSLTVWRGSADHGPEGTGAWDVDYYELRDGASSFYGTYQQGRNLSEWNDAINGGNRAVRGGALPHSYDRLASSVRDDYATKDEFRSLGFRVAVLRLTTVPEPGTYAAATGLAMLVIGIWLRRV
ncbi:MAG: hypothetical protein LBK99_15725 [Opitutaceae bacterium]|nr:hypothetical protein [Opitutaceae bacterium]